MLIDSKTKKPIDLNTERCKLHPKYKGIRKPTKRHVKDLGICQCWSIYMNNHADEKFPDFISGVPRSLNDWREMGKESAEHLLKMIKEHGPMNKW